MLLKGTNLFRKKFYFCAIDAMSTIYNYISTFDVYVPTAEIEDTMPLANPFLLSKYLGMRTRPKKAQSGLEIPVNSQRMLLQKPSRLNEWALKYLGLSKKKKDINALEVKDVNHNNIPNFIVFHTQKKWYINRQWRSKRSRHEQIDWLKEISGAVKKSNLTTPQLPSWVLPPRTV